MRVSVVSCPKAPVPRQKLPPQPHVHRIPPSEIAAVCHWPIDRLSMAGLCPSAASAMASRISSPSVVSAAGAEEEEDGSQPSCPYLLEPYVYRIPSETNPECSGPAAATVTLRNSSNGTGFASLTPGVHLHSLPSPGEEAKNRRPLLALRRFPPQRLQPEAVGAAREIEFAIGRNIPFDVNCIHKAKARCCTRCEETRKEWSD
mmetsp:Transcript_68201/g.142518  ORF Transcript_68201/g.142518 Transcript_68201/m.142518 type:complete len:203 (-) Transcript_68201:59-667(-)